MAFHDYPFTQFNEENLDWLIKTVKNAVGTTVSGVLTSGETSITLESPVIKSDSLIDIYTNVFGLTPNSVSSGDGYVNLNFTAQSDDVTIKLIVKNF